MSASTFKNVIPKRKYRERSQPQNREHLGLLEKKKDYKARAKNYHQKEDMINRLRNKATLKNEDEFYFKMSRGKQNQDGKFVIDDDDSDFDEKEYRASLKTENYGIAMHQRSIVEGKINKLKGQLHMLSTGAKLNKHKVFVDSQQELQNFKPEAHWQTAPELLERGILDVSLQALSHEMPEQSQPIRLKEKYNRLAEYLQKHRKLTKIMEKLRLQRDVLGKQRSRKKNHKGKKIHKFFIERKK